MLNKNKIIPWLADHLPSIAIKAVPLVPSSFSRFTLERLLNQFFKKELALGSLDFMRNNWVHICVRDIAFGFYVSVQQEQNRAVLQVRHYHVQPDVALAGNINDLLLLMTQHIDPDTLFFQRKLTLRGDTELGLELKNFLDTIELDTHLPRRVHQWSLEIANIVSEHQTASH